MTSPHSLGTNPFLTWAELEPREGVYNWAPLDKVLEATRKAGRLSAPRILTNFSIFGQASPDWFFDLNGADHYYPSGTAKSSGFEAPVPWDSTYQEKFSNFLRAMGQRYDGNPTIAFIQVAGVGVYGEMYMGSSNPDGYTVDKHKSAIRYWTDAWRSAFPNTNLALSVNYLGNNIGRDGASHAVSRGFYLQMNDPTGNSGTRAILSEHDDQTKIVVEAENHGCREATGSEFQKLMDQVFAYDHAIDYLMLCSESFNHADTAAVLPSVQARLRGGESTPPPTTSDPQEEDGATSTPESPSGGAQLVSPAAGSVLPSRNVTFSWTRPSGAREYRFDIGSTPGGKQYFSRDKLYSSSLTFEQLASDGRTYYVRLWTMFNSGWVYNDYTFQASMEAVSSGGSTPVREGAEIYSPEPGAQFSRSWVNFRWTEPQGAREYRFDLGSTPGGTQYHKQDKIYDNSLFLTDLARDGRTYYVRLWTLFADGWVYNDYTYRADN